MAEPKGEKKDGRSPLIAGLSFLAFVAFVFALAIANWR